jgi:hypothetical protein
MPDDIAAPHVVTTGCYEAEYDTWIDGSADVQRTDADGSVWLFVCRDIAAITACSITID